ncbi:MAG: carbon monoxide dehydrogenase [Betaproteobacteria bacterium]|nr:carbon monoxide dehydrogenase [Betaproteobacteria bacterium]
MYDFSYHRPSDLDAAAAIVGAHDDYKLLAGGMSLIPSLKMRLARYPGIVDLSGLDALRGIRRSGTTLLIGAMTAHAEVAASAEVAGAIPALAVLAEGIGDPLVRNRGTIGGSIANADPAADYPAALLGLDALVITNRREIGADDFFLGLFETALEPGEIITAVRFPIPQAAGYCKYPQPASRFALAGVFVSKLAECVRVAVTGAAPRVFRLEDAERALGGNFHPAAIERLAVAHDGLNSDIHASAQYRAHCVAVLAARAVAAARHAQG